MLVVRTAVMLVALGVARQQLGFAQLSPALVAGLCVWALGWWWAIEQPRRLAARDQGPRHPSRQGWGWALMVLGWVGFTLDFWLPWIVVQG